MTIRIERSGLVAMRTRRAEAQGICSRSPVMFGMPVANSVIKLLIRHDSQPTFRSDRRVMTGRKRWLVALRHSERPESG